MKRLLLVLALIAAPTFLQAQVADRDILLTPDGALYTVESVRNDGSAPPEVQVFLRLTVQRADEKPQTMTVPDSLTAGTHSEAALAYDSSSKTLFVFWLKMPNPMSSELLLSSYHDGIWQPAVSIGSHTWRLEFNLRIRTSHRTGDDPLLVHAVWWEETGDGESARYGLFVIDKGVVSTIYLDDLNNFLSVDSNNNPITPAPTRFDVDPNFNNTILRHPALVDNGTADSIDVIFGDVRTKSFNRITLQPVIQGRIHIPIGAHPGGPRIAAPKFFTDAWSGPISTMLGRDGSLLVYNATKDSVNYLVYSSSAWSAVQSVPLSNKLSADAAIAALSRMMNQ
jgi:hypothetical protein